MKIQPVEYYFQTGEKLLISSLMKFSANLHLNSLHFKRICVIIISVQKIIAQKNS